MISPRYRLARSALLDLEEIWEYWDQQSWLATEETAGPNVATRGIRIGNDTAISVRDGYRFHAAGTEMSR